MIYNKDTTKLTGTLSVELDKDFIELVNSQYDEVLKENSADKTEEQIALITQELNKRKEVALEDELEVRMIEELQNEALDLANYTLLTNDKITGRKIYVNKGNPTLIAIISGINVSQATIQGTFFHLLNKFVKQNTLAVLELDSTFKNSIVTNFGLTLVQSKVNKNVEGNFNAVGANIYKTNTEDILFVASFSRMVKDAPVVSVFEQFKHGEAKAIIENMEAFEQALKEKEVK